MKQPDFENLAEQFDHPDVRALVLMGSYARGDDGPFSDVDLVRFSRDEETILEYRGSHLIDGRLIVVSDVTPSQVEAAFTQPELAVDVIQGLRLGRALIDKDGFFVTLQQRANSFRWDEAMQEKANRWASRQMVGWIEEVHKGLEGLIRDDVGRMLHAKFGCTWGLARVMCVQRGVLLSGDNALFEEVTHSMGTDSGWTQLLRAAYGVDDEPSMLHQQVIAGLCLYGLTADLLKEVLQEEDAPMVMESAALISDSLSAISSLSGR